MGHQRFSVSSLLKSTPARRTSRPSTPTAPSSFGETLLIRFRYGMSSTFVASSSLSCFTSNETLETESRQKRVPARSPLGQDRIAVILINRCSMRLGRLITYESGVWHFLLSSNGPEIGEASGARHRLTQDRETES